MSPPAWPRRCARRTWDASARCSPRTGGTSRRSTPACAPTRWRAWSRRLRRPACWAAKRRARAPADRSSFRPGAAPTQSRQSPGRPAPPCSPWRGRWGACRHGDRGAARRAESGDRRVARSHGLARAPGATRGAAARGDAGDPGAEGAALDGRWRLSRRRRGAGVRPLEPGLAPLPALPRDLQRRAPRRLLGALSAPLARRAGRAPRRARRARRPPRGGGAGRRDSACLCGALFPLPQPGQRARPEPPLLLHLPRVPLDRQHPRGGGAAARVGRPGRGDNTRGEPGGRGSGQPDRRVRRGVLQPPDVEQRRAGGDRLLVRGRGPREPRDREPDRLLAHLMRGFGPDGMWYEGENYHLFALRGLLTGVGWAAQAGIDAFAEPALAQRLRAALLAPARSALPDFTFPARKDSRFGVSLAHPMYLELWEVGLGNLGRREAGRGMGDLTSWLTTL